MEHPYTSTILLIRRLETNARKSWLLSTSLLLYWRVCICLYGRIPDLVVEGTSYKESPYVKPWIPCLWIPWPSRTSFRSTSGRETASQVESRGGNRAVEGFVFSGKHEEASVFSVANRCTPKSYRSKSGKSDEIWIAVIKLASQKKRFFGSLRHFLDGYEYV